MLRRDSLEDTENHERWLVSYADFMTLLFGFFLVMYAISSVNEGKYRVLSSALSAAFEAAPKSLDPIQLGEPLLAASPHLIDIPDETGYRDEDDGDADLPFTARDAERELADLVDAEVLSITGDQQWLELSLDANVLFNGGDAILSAAAQQVLRETADYLRSFSNPLTIEGYTDNVPVSGRYRSNWELASVRAASVAAFLVSQGIDRRRLAAVGYGENHPLTTNGTPEGRSANRRVTIVVARQLTVPTDTAGRATFAAVRQAAPIAPPLQQRSQDGGLLFSNEIQPGVNP